MHILSACYLYYVHIRKRGEKADMKEKRYEIFKKGELEGRNPNGINAFSDPQSDENGNILKNRSKYETCAPRSSLNNNMYNDLMNSKSAAPKKDGKPQGSTPGISQIQATDKGKTSKKK